MADLEGAPELQPKHVSEAIRYRSLCRQGLGYGRPTTHDSEPPAHIAGAKDGGADALLRTASTRLGLSARAYHRILKIARTIADLDEVADLQPKRVSEAIQYRSLDRRGVG